MPIARTLLVLLFILSGCSAQIDAEKLANSEASYHDGIKLYESKNFSDAEKSLTVAIDGGGLNVDLRTEALLKRVICRAELNQFDAAHQDLDELATAAPLDEWHVARAFVFRKQGEEGKSQAEMEQAIAINPEIELGID